MRGGAVAAQGIGGSPDEQTHAEKLVRNHGWNLAGIDAPVNRKFRSRGRRSSEQLPRIAGVRLLAPGLGGCGLRDWEPEFGRAAVKGLGTAAVVEHLLDELAGTAVTSPGEVGFDVACCFFGKVNVHRLRSVSLWGQVVKRVVQRSGSGPFAAAWESLLPPLVDTGVGGGYARIRRASNSRAAGFLDPSGC